MYRLQCAGVSTKRPFVLIVPRSKNLNNLGLPPDLPTRDQKSLAKLPKIMTHDWWPLNHRGDILSNRCVGVFNNFVLCCKQLTFCKCYIYNSYNYRSHCITVIIVHRIIFKGKTVVLIFFFCASLIYTSLGKTYTTETAIIFLPSEPYPARYLPSPDPLVLRLIWQTPTHNPLIIATSPA